MLGLRKGPTEHIRVGAQREVHRTPPPAETVLSVFDGDKGDPTGNANERTGSEIGGEAWESRAKKKNRATS